MDIEETRAAYRRALEGTRPTAGRPDWPGILGLRHADRGVTAEPALRDVLDTAQARLEELIEAAEQLVAAIRGCDGAMDDPVVLRAMARWKEARG